MNQRGFIFTTSILLTAVLLLSACSLPWQRTAGEPTPTAMPPVIMSSAIMVEGRLVPNQTANLVFPSGGRMIELLVQEGSQVQAGQLIARLDGTAQLQAAIEASEFELLSAQQAIELLDENYAVELADALQKLAQAKIELEDAEEDRTSMNYRRASDSTLNGLRADVILAQEEADKAQDFYDHNRQSDELIQAQALSQLSAAQKALDRARYNLRYASDLPDKNEIDKADARIQIAKASLDAARLSLDRLAAGPDTKALALAQARLERAETDLRARQSQLENLELSAPFSGRIVDLNFVQGEDVLPGQTVAILVDFSRWIVETSDLTELNVVDVQVGQKATLIADALPDQEFSGTVERISDAYIEKQGDVTYTVEIVLDQVDERLRWGMTFAVELEQSETDQQSSAVQPQAEATPTPAAEPTEVMEDSTSLAETAVRDYFAALEQGNAHEAANLLSNYSLTAKKVNRQSASDMLAAQLAQGNRWSELTVQENRVLDAETVLFHVTYQKTDADSDNGGEAQQEQDEWWPVRLENGQWLVNWDNLIAFQELDITGQTTGGLTVTPVQITRYPDRYRLTLFVQNRTNETIVLGQANETLARFTFSNQAVDAEPAQLVFQSMQTYPETEIEVKGAFPNYPEQVDIRIWKNYDVPPWYSFDLE